MARRLPKSQSEYLKDRLESNDIFIRKRTLQEIENLYRKGFVFPEEIRSKIETIINGIMCRADVDIKILRWCLNCVARFGTKSGSEQSVKFLLNQHSAVPEIVASAVSALANLYKENLYDIKELENIPSEIRFLSALKILDYRKIQDRSIRIDPLNASAELMKLSLIVIGTGKACEHLFHSKYENSVFIKEFFGHDDSIIQQYAVWCVLENQQLDLECLGIDLTKTDSYAPNIQSKILQLGLTRNENRSLAHSLLLEFSQSDIFEVREGLGKGLKTVYYDGILDATIPWFDMEENIHIKEYLAEHFARNSDKCPVYFSKSKEIFESDTLLRKTIKVASERKDLHRWIVNEELGRNTPSLLSEHDDLITMKIKESSVDRTEMILMLAANPKDETYLKLTEEFQLTKDACYHSRSSARPLKLDLNIVMQEKKLLQYLLEAKPTIVHFCGHSDRNSVLFEDELHDGFPVKKRDFLNLVRKATRAKCVILNSCSSLIGITQQHGYNFYLIGTLQDIDDRAAIFFATYFYTAYSSGSDINKSFELAVNALRTSGYNEEAKKYRLYTPCDVR